MGVYSQSLRNLWKEWNKRTLVLISLTFQVLLVCFGSRRKYNPKLWIRIVVWSAYLAAHSLATLALGAISSELLETYDSSGKVNPDVELNAFWAPFLLLHLGGPDTITAYALEDNELWLRHLLGLFFQTGVTVSVCLLAWTGSRLSVLAILMILVGLFKYRERTWVLWRASGDQLDKFPPINEENARLLGAILSHANDRTLVSQDSMVFVASWLIFLFMPSMVNKPRIAFLKGNIWDFLLEAPAEMISKLIEVELGFMYDLLYTKARVVYTPCSLALRVIGFFLTCIELVLFTIGVSLKNSYSKVDVAITFVLLVGAITIDLYAAFALLSSNWTTALLFRLTQYKSCYQAIADCQKYLNKSSSWPNSISQFSLLRFCFGEKKPVRFDCILKQYFPGVHKKQEQQESLTYTEFTDTDTLKGHIIRKAQQKHNESRSATQGVGNVVDDVPLQKNTLEELNPYRRRDIKENIVAWQIATEICYYLEDEKAAGKVQREISLHISQYMLSLLVRYPSMLLAKMNADLFENACRSAIKFCEAETRYFPPPITKSEDFHELYKYLRSVYGCRSDYERRAHAASSSWFTDGDLISAAVLLSLKLDERSSKEMKWKMISDVWLEMLLDVASQWKGNEHGQQLRRGGEFLTHVWLLMVHLDLA